MADAKRAGRPAALDLIGPHGGLRADAPYRLLIYMLYPPGHNDAKRTELLDRLGVATRRQAPTSLHNVLEALGAFDLPEPHTVPSNIGLQQRWQEGVNTGIILFTLIQLNAHPLPVAQPRHGRTAPGSPLRTVSLDIAVKIARARSS